MKSIISILLLTLISLESFSQKKDLIYLWPGKVPGELKEKQEGALQDAQRAIRIVRRNAAKWSIDPEKVGTMGFSAAC
ncbi:MAG: hypothetical protein WC854_05145 [Bacteroidales bacterium]